jgi:DNA-binding response OmpR family regulator
MERRLQEERPDLIVLTPSGAVDLDRALYADVFPGSRLTVTVASVLGDDTDRILGLEMGAQTISPNPITLAELLARIRRSCVASVHATPSANVFSFAGLELGFAQTAPGAAPTASRPR